MSCLILWLMFCLGENLFATLKSAQKSLFWRYFNIVLIELNQVVRQNIFLQWIAVMFFF